MFKVLNRNWILTTYRQITNRLPAISHLSADRWFTPWKKLSANSRPTVDQQLADSWPTVGRQLTDSRRRGAVLHNYLKLGVEEWKCPYTRDNELKNKILQSEHWFVKNPNSVADPDLFIRRGPQPLRALNLARVRKIFGPSALKYFCQ